MKWGGYVRLHPVTERIVATVSVIAVAALLLFLLALG